MESRRQKKVAKLIQQTLSEIFQKHGPSFYGRAFVTITDVTITSDLLISKVYLSIYNIPEKEEVLKQITRHHNQIRRHLGTKVKNQMRRIPEFLFYLDDTIDESVKLEELFKEIEDDRESKED